MSKKFSEMGLKLTFVNTDSVPILDSEDPVEDTQNKRVEKPVFFAGYATQSSVDTVQSNLDTHAAGSVATSHPDGVTQTDLNNHKTAANQHPTSGVTGLDAALAAKANTADLGNSATRDVGTGAGDVAQGDAPAAAVTGHESSFDHTLINSVAQKAALEGNPALGGGNVVPGRSELPTADQQAALNAANSPSGTNAFRVMSDGHATLPDLNTSGHPGAVITIGGGVEDNAVAIAADGSLKDAGVPPGGAGGTTNLGNNPTSTNVEITSSSGTNTTVAGATNTVAGVATAAQITQLEGTDAAGTARPPTAHASTHNQGQTDEIALADLSSGAATNGQVPHANGSGGIAWQTPVTGGAGFERTYNFNSTVGTPTWGEVRLDAAQGSETELRFNQQDTGNNYVSPIIANLQIGDAITFSDISGTIRNYIVNGAAVDNGTWFSIPITIEDATLTLVNATAYLTLFTLLGGASAGWQDGTTIGDWGLTPQNLGTIGGSTTAVDLDSGHHITATLSADHTINFTSTANHPATQWTATIATAGFTPTFQFGGVAVDLPKDYDLSGSPARINFSFVKDTFGVSVSERQVP